ncbi:MAG: TRAP transporter substrate-binding protein DctP [Myxococcales bacterium]|nr:TRAP transporter substrate-binding protein DctP [Myxococcales bacterium]
MRVFVMTLVLGALCATMPGASVQAGEAKTIIKVATMVPRTSNVVLEAKRFNKDLAEATDGRVQFRTYYGGTAGDEKTVLRKIRAGQIDAAPLGNQMVSHFVRQAMIFMAPQTFHNYKQVDAVRKKIAPEFNEEAYRNGFKILSWFDMGKARIFSKKPIRNFNDLRTGRPWLYPESPLLREFYKMIDVTGVPLGLNEVYGGLQTDMIDTVWISSVLAMALQWHAKTEFVSARPVLILQGAFSVRRQTWDALSESDRDAIAKITKKNQKDFQKRFRKDDAVAYKKMLKRGKKPFKFSDEAEWAVTGKKLRDRMVGRIYDRALLERVEKIAAKYAGESTDMLVAR